MNRRFNISAPQMALLSVLGAVVASSGFVLPIFFPRASAAFVPSLVLSFVLVIVGFGISMLSESSITNGIAAERWPEEKVAALRRLVQSSLWKALSIFCVVVYVAAIIAFASSPYRPLTWIGFIFSMMFFRLRAAVIPFPSAVLPRVADWNSGSPLQSEHWGER